MTFDRDQVIERAAQKAEDQRVPVTLREDIATALPVIADSVLAPLEELHCEEVDSQAFRGTCIQCVQRWPCPTVSLIEQIKAAARGGS